MAGDSTWVGPGPGDYQWVEPGDELYSDNPDPDWVPPTKKDEGYYTPPANPDYGTQPDQEPFLGFPPNTDWDPKTGQWVTRPPVPPSKPPSAPPPSPPPSPPPLPPRPPRDPNPYPPPGPNGPVSGPLGGERPSDIRQRDFRFTGTPGVFPGPVQQVGQDPLSQQITKSLMGLMESGGKTPLGRDMDQTLRGLITRQGAIDENPLDRAQRMEKRRQPIEAFRRMQTNQMRGELADRNLLSVPGVPQGSEISGLGRLEERLAPHYAPAGQEISTEDFAAQNARLSQALTLATGMSETQSNTLLATIGAGTERQNVLSQIALGTLDRNIAWNQFLARLGLDRARIMEEMQAGRVAALEPLLQLFTQQADIASGGFI